MEMNNSEESPPHSRLFIICDRDLSKEDYHESFSKFGHIEEIRLPRDYKTGQSKGVAYIKFSKTSEAAAALEAMHLQALKGSSRPIKVMVARNRAEIHSEDNYPDKYKRLFITVPHTTNEQDIHDVFTVYGPIESVVVLREPHTGKPKGFAYVTFQKFLTAAHAFEQCDKKYRAIFAMPKGSKPKHSSTTFDSRIDALVNTASDSTTIMSSMNTAPRGFTQVKFMCCPNLNYTQVCSLFDLIPGLLDCRFDVDLYQQVGKGLASYGNPVSAAYAVDKLNEFEYPPGMKIYVKPEMSSFEMHNQPCKNLSRVTHNVRNAMKSTNPHHGPDLAQLAGAIADASKLIKMATKGVGEEDTPDSNELNYCSVQLPKPQCLANIDSTVAKRCFLVCKPQPPPLTVLRDIFCRFGDLINVYTLPNKTVGYARYASVRAADEAIKVLHGAEVCGIRMKVLEAEDEAPPRKRRFENSTGQQND